MAIHLSDLNAAERQRLRVVDTPDQQEERAREAVSWPAILKVALAAGLYFFIFPGGTPWTSGAVAGVMGRLPNWPWHWLIAAHFGLSLVYTAVIACAVFREKIYAAIATGVLIGFFLFGINFALFANIGTQRGDGRALAAHLIFGAFAAAMYKAVSIPPPSMQLDGKPVD